MAGHSEIPAWESYALALVTGYETVALFVRDDSKVPTLTYLQSRYPVLGAAMVAFLATHFVRYDRQGKQWIPIAGFISRTRFCVQHPYSLH
jgi:hypothetical protein